ncbi:MAG: diguanylate cyclase, partial [Proteobacteria bacterium]|nr:diguanylate cyclase [Pseudomonadota bacterium]
MSTLILSAGFSVYSVMQPQTEAMAASGLKVALQNTVKLIENQISHSISNARIITANILLSQNLENANTGRSKEEVAAELQHAADKILNNNHFSGIRIYDAADNLIVAAGVDSGDPDSRIELNTD